MAVFRWHNGKVPSNLKIKQVYGIIFTSDGRLLLMVKNKQSSKIFSLAGGTPEKYDIDSVATLKRELLEEVNVTIKEPITVGYQEVDEENGTEKYAQFRMTAIIDNIGPCLPDPDNGEIYDRLLTTPSKAIELLGWGEVGKSQIEEAVRIVKEQLGLNTFIDNDEYV